MRIISGSPDFCYRLLLRQISTSKLTIKITLEEFIEMCKRSGSIMLMGVKYSPNLDDNV